MSDKVIITKKQAEIVQSLLDEGRSTVEYTLRQHVIDPKKWSGANLLPLREMTFDTLVRAFYIGYEVEQTTEERLIELVRHYEQRVKTSSSSQESEFWDGKLKGVEEALNIIGMKVKGINE